MVLSRVRATRGDNVQANVNSGEMILNTGQQAQLFDMANGSTGGGTTFNMYLDGKMIASNTVDNYINKGVVTVDLKRGTR